MHAAMQASRVSHTRLASRCASVLLVVVLRSDSPGVAVGAIDRRQIANVDGMFERLRLHLCQMRSTFLLIEKRVAGIAVLADDPAVLADMIAIVTAEAARIIHVPDVVRMGLPVDLHRGEKR